jgi:phospholipid transport system substrate-binding protein
MLRRFAFRPLLLLAIVAPAGATAWGPTVAQAAQSDPAAAKIEALDAALVQAMKAGKSAGPQGRFKIMAPAVDAAFDIPAMAGYAVGSAWPTLSADDKSALIAAFRRFTIASYAKNFDSYDGQKLTVAPDVQTRGPDKLVKTQMTAGTSNVILVYRMRQSGGSWKVIDVFFNGTISQLTTQRSDFSATLAQGGPKALVAKLNAQSETLLK